LNFEDEFDRRENDGFRKKDDGFTKVVERKRVEEKGKFFRVYE